MAETSNRKTYHEQTYIDNTLRLREILKTLPPFAKDYFRAVEPTTSARTRISYAYDIRVFFHFLMENNPVYKNYTIEQFEVHDLERLEPVDIEEYQEYLKVYKLSLIHILYRTSVLLCFHYIVRFYEVKCLTNICSNDIMKT